MAHAWKACWGQPLKGSNPLSSATNEGPERTAFRAFVVSATRSPRQLRARRPRTVDAGRCPARETQLVAVDVQLEPQVQPQRPAHALAPGEPGTVELQVQQLLGVGPLGPGVPESAPPSSVMRTVGSIRPIGVVMVRSQSPVTGMGVSLLVSAVVRRPAPGPRRARPHPGARGRRAVPRRARSSARVPAPAGTAPGPDRT